MVVLFNVLLFLLFTLMSTKYKTIEKYQNSDLKTLYVQSKVPLEIHIDNTSLSVQEFGIKGYEILLLIKDSSLTINGYDVKTKCSSIYEVIDSNIFYICSYFKSCTRISFEVPIFVGHRGMGMNSFHKNVLYEENTIASFKHTAQKKIKWIEFDVNLTKDDLPVIFHDFTKHGKLIQNMTNKEFLENYSHISDKSNHAINSYNYDIAELNPCSLEDVFQKCSCLSFNIEIKYPYAHDLNKHAIDSFKNVDSYVSSIMDVVRKANKTDLFISSFSLDVCVYLRYAYSEYNVYYLCETNVDYAIGVVIYYDFAGLVIDSRLYSDDLVNLLHEKNKLLLVYGEETNNKEWVKKFIDSQGDGIISDVIDEAFIKDNFYLSLNSNKIKFFYKDKQ